MSGCPARGEKRGHADKERCGGSPIIASAVAPRLTHAQAGRLASAQCACRLGAGLACPRWVAPVIAARDSEFPAAVALAAAVAAALS